MEEPKIKRPTLGNGKVCYIEIPSDDPNRSADFYHSAFGWHIRRRSNGEIAFDDSAGEVSGTWTVSKLPVMPPGLLLYLRLLDINAGIDTILRTGGKLVQPVGADAPEITARISDPSGNIFGVFSEHQKKPGHLNGMLCYIEIPTEDANRSADFYQKVFGWNIRKRSGGQLAFDDGVNKVSGTWTLGRTPVTAPGMLVHIMVRSMTVTLTSVLASGGKIVQDVGADTPEITARIADPAGNIIGVYQGRELH